MTTKVCRTCKVEKPLTEFFSNGFQPNGKQKFKPDCGVCCHINQRQTHYAKLVEILAELGMRPECTLCGYNRNWSALCFHHLDEDQKDFEINSAKTASKQRLKAEIEKCVLLCHNCHMEVHYPQNEIVVDDQQLG